MMVELFIYLLLLITDGTSDDEYKCGGNYDLFDKNVISSLKSSGYVIQEGYMRWYSNESAYAANPSLFYGLFVFNRTKPWLNIELEPTHIIENKEEYEIRLNLNDIDDIRPHMNYDEFWYMYGSEAIIWYGCHAPADYYSYRSYQNRRINPKHPSNAYNDSQNNNEKYPETDTYGSLGDMLNNYNINSTINGLQIVVSTPDNKTYNDIERIILNNNNLHLLNLTNKNQINLDIMPYDNIPVDGPGFGKEKNSTNIYYLKYPREDGPQKQILNGESLDGIGIMVRFGLPFNNISNNIINSYLNTKQKVYRIYYPYPKNNSNNWDIPREKFKKLFVHNLSTGIYEQDILEPYFTKYSYLVHKYFKSFGKNKEWRYENTKISQPFYNSNHKYGFNCVKYGTRCMADNRDAQYFLTWPDYSIMTNTSIFIFTGIIHKDMSKCQWENIVPYFANSGIHSKFFRSHYLDYLSPKYRYSALQFPPNVNQSGIPSNILNKFFIVAAMRPQMCAKYFDNNIQYPQLKNIPKFCFDNNDFNYSSPQRWFMVHRCYINPTTQTRPDADEMIPFISMQYETQWFESNHA
eukprot:362006_1